MFVFKYRLKVVNVHTVHEDEEQQQNKGNQKPLSYLSVPYKPTFLKVEVSFSLAVFWSLTNLLPSCC